MKDFKLEFEKPLHDLERQLAHLQKQAAEQKIDLSEEIRGMEAKLEKTRKEIYSGLTVWQRVQLSRHPRRPHTLDTIQAITDEFWELHGDRLFQDDHAMVGGLATLKPDPQGHGKNGHAIRVVILGQQKGRDTKQNLMRNFGMPHPEGYRKALRLMRMAHKFRLPIVTLIDTPGAYPGIGAEERHIAEAIAVNLREMTLFEVPIVAIVIGEGGSGGALGIGVADSVLILENAYYSVISPEGCAAILWKDRSHAARAAEALRLSARDLLEHGMVDVIVPEPLGGAQRDPEVTSKNLLGAIHTELKKLREFPVRELLNRRYERYRRIGKFEEPSEK
ncbi:MAG: acetyl-CoA carboxylase carboxyltransferase subunit alpha [Verrucomicrobiae bacterium]|nr:acetyl-CoA carboxylase carboxyltransferase subunit alpha [Verrucomicrobiae bacterium]